MTVQCWNERCGFEGRGNPLHSAKLFCTFFYKPLMSFHMSVRHYYTTFATSTQRFIRQNLNVSKTSISTSDHHRSLESQCVLSSCSLHLCLFCFTSSSGAAHSTACVLLWKQDDPPKLSVLDFDIARTCTGPIRDREAREMCVILAARSLFNAAGVTCAFMGIREMRYLFLFFFFIPNF